MQVEEPTPAQAVEILNGLAPRYERYHNVRLPPQTLQAAVELSVRYLPGRCLPDKAIDLVDEACAAARILAEKEQRTQQPGGGVLLLILRHIKFEQCFLAAEPADRQCPRQCSLAHAGRT